MRTIAIFSLAIALATTAASQAPSKKDLDQRAIAAAKQVSVKSLDPALPDVPLEKWFQGVVGSDAKTWWEANDCGEQTGDPKTTPADPPLCAQVSAMIGDEGLGATVMVAVGTYKKGITGKPTVFYAGADAGEDVSAPVKELHELPDAIKKLQL